jgi:hypothetical protein
VPRRKLRPEGRVKGDDLAPGEMRNLRAQAKALYFEGLSIPTIALELHLTKGRVARWSSEDGGWWGQRYDAERRRRFLREPADRAALATVVRAGVRRAALSLRRFGLGNAKALREVELAAALERAKLEAVRS